MRAIQENIFNSTLFRRSDEKYIKKAGKWSCEFRYKGKVFMAKKFLVIPSHDIFESGNSDVKNEWYKNFETFWRHNSICVKSIENRNYQKSYFHSRMFKNCFDSAKWSTYYPDPKSDLEQSFSLDFKSRK